MKINEKLFMIGYKNLEKVKEQFDKIIMSEDNTEVVKKSRLAAMQLESLMTKLDDLYQETKEQHELAVKALLQNKTGH